MTPVPRTRDQAVELLQKLGWDDSQLGPEEMQAVRALFFLDDPRTVAERLQVHPPERIPLPRGARYIHPRQSRQEAE